MSSPIQRDITLDPSVIHTFLIDIQIEKEPFDHALATGGVPSADAVASAKIFFFKVLVNQRVRAGIVKHVTNWSNHTPPVEKELSDLLDDTVDPRVKRMAMKNIVGFLRDITTYLETQEKLKLGTS